MKKNVHHIHLVATAHTYRNSMPKLSTAVLKQHLLKLVRVADMKVLIPPQVAYSREAGNTGFTGFVGITTSHITFHHWDCVEPGILQFDLYSAKPFTMSKILNCLNLFWHCDFNSVFELRRYPKTRIKRYSTQTSETNFMN